MTWWLKLGYFTNAPTEGDADYWMGRYWVSDGPGRDSPRWRTRPRPRRGKTYPPYGPRYEIGDLLVVYMQGRGCPAILEVTAVPRWDPTRVDREAARGEGDRWGVVTEVRGLHSVALRDAPTLEAIGVPSSSVQRKGHIELAEWQFMQAEALIIGSARSQRQRAGRSRREHTHIPIEEGEVEGYQTASPGDVRRAVRRESRLVREYASFLEDQGETVTRTRATPEGNRSPIYSDLFNRTRNHLVEAKANTTRSDVRMAIGQLADYGRFVGSDVRKAVLLEAKPHPDLLELLDTQDIAAVWRDGDGFDDNADGAFT